MEPFGGTGVAHKDIACRLIRYYVLLHACVGNCVRGMIYAIFAIYLPQLLCALDKYCICVRFDVNFPGKIRLSSMQRLTFRNLCVKSDCFGIIISIKSIFDNFAFICSEMKDNSLRNDGRDRKIGLEDIYHLYKYSPNTKP